MSKDIASLFPEGLLTEDTLNAVEAAFKDRLKLHIEAALQEQDELYASKLETLLEAIEKDHTQKLLKVVDAIDKNNTHKLKVIAKKFNGTINEEATTFKENLVNNISNYLDLYIEELIPTEDIKQAVKNKQAFTVLEDLRKNLAVDSALMKESVRTAVIDGKQTISSQQEKISTLEKELKQFKEAHNKVMTELFLEKKTAGMGVKKKEFLTKALFDKEYKFITENFDYTAKLFDRKEKEQLTTIKEQAFEQRVVKADKPVQTITENAKPKIAPVMASYLSELKR